MKRKFLSMLLMLLLIMNPVLPWVKIQTVSAENVQILSIEDETFYNQLKTGITPNSAVQSNDLNKTIELDMEAITHITMNMSGVKMTDANKEIVRQLFQECTQLRALRLSDCDLSGFSDVDFSGLDNKNSLTTLCLVGCELDKVPTIKLPELTSMCLTSNSLSAEDACKSITADNFPNLTSLFMDRSDISDIAFVKNMNKLTTLSFGNAELTNDSIAALLNMSSNLPNLTCLNLGASEHDDIFFGNKSQSYLSSTNKITDTKSLALLPSQFPQLNNLDLSGLRINSLQDFVGIRENIDIDFQVNLLTDFAGFESNYKFNFDRQKTSISYNFAQGWGGEIPELLKRVMDENDALYGTLKYKYCSLSDDGKMIVIQADAPSYLSPSVEVNSGRLDGTVFSLTLKKFSDPAVPEKLTATEGDTLAKVVLPEGFAWKDFTQDVGEAGIRTFLADYTMEYEGHEYVKYDIEVPVTVKSATAKPSPSPTPTLSPSPTPTLIPSPMPTLSSSPTPTLSPSPTPTLSPSLTPTLSPSLTPTLSPSLTPTLSPSPTPLLSPSPTSEVTEQPVVTPMTRPDESKLTGNQIEKRKDLSLLLAIGKQRNQVDLEKKEWLFRLRGILVVL